MPIAAFSSELLVKDCSADIPKIEFSANKILAKRFFDNLSDDMLDHHSRLPFVQLRFGKNGRFNSGWLDLVF
jgi:hypothetical protein